MTLFPISVNNKAGGGKLGAKLEEEKHLFSTAKVKSVDESGLFFAKGVRAGFFFVSVDGEDVSKLSFKEVQAKVVAANKKMNEGGTISFSFTDDPDHDPYVKVNNSENHDDACDEEGDDEEEGEDEEEEEDPLLDDDKAAGDENKRNSNATSLWAQAAQGGNNPGWHCSVCLSKSPFGSPKCLSCEAINPNAPPPTTTATSEVPTQGGGAFVFAGALSNPSTATFGFGFGPTDPTKPPPFAIPAFGAIAGAPPPPWARPNEGISSAPFGNGSFGAGAQAQPQSQHQTSVFGFGGGGGGSNLAQSTGASVFGGSASVGPGLSFGGNSNGAVSLPTFNFSAGPTQAAPSAVSTSAQTLNFSSSANATQSASTTASTFASTSTLAPKFDFSNPAGATQSAAPTVTSSLPTTITPATAAGQPISPSISTDPSSLKVSSSHVVDSVVIPSQLKSSLSTASISANSTVKLTQVSPPGHTSSSSQVSAHAHATNSSLSFPLDPSLSAHDLSARGVLKLKPDAASLSGRFITLEPYDEALHLDSLARALLGEPYLGHTSYDAEMLVWRYLWGSPVNKVGLKERLAESSNCPDRRLWALRLIETKEIVGVIALIANRPFDLVVEIGLVMVTPAYQRTPVASDATFALLNHVFSLKYRRVEWKTNVHNKRSRKAAERMGFVQEGIFRSHMIVQGGANRDTAWYSMITEDWNSTKVCDQDAWLDSPAARELFEKRKRELVNGV
jgi:RimJ/RimL family protein N-acetyltransferase